jgi:Integrase core domain
LRSQSRDRLPPLAALTGERLGGTHRPSSGAEAPATSLVGCGRGGDPRGALVRQRRPGDRGWSARAAGLDCLEGAPSPCLPQAPREPAQRYERQRAGELVHVDIKKLGRFFTVGKAILGDRLTRSEGAGWQYLHLAIDDHSRLAYAELLPSESPAACVAFLHRAHGWYAEQGIRVERVLSDNGNGYRSHLWAAACLELGIDRRYTRPRRPQTNGKAEALVKTLLREWAYRFAYPTSAHRARALPGYLRWYNRHRPHGSLGGSPPISRVSQVCGSHS